MRRLTLVLLPLLLLPSLVFAQSTGSAGGSLTIDFSKVQVNAQKQAIFNKQLNDIVANLKANISSLGTSRMTKVVMLYPSGISGVCGSGTKNTTIEGCYNPKTGQLTINSDLFGSTADAQEVTAHEILHSFTPNGNGYNLPDSADNGATFEEMLVEHFAQESYPSTLGGYSWLEGFVSPIQDILAAAGEANPDQTLADAMFNGTLTQINDIVSPFLTSPNFLAGLGQYISTDPDKTNAAAANSYLANVLQKVTQCNTPTTSDSSGTDTTGTTPPATCPVKPPATPTTNPPTTPTNGTTKTTPPTTTTSSTGGTCNGAFSVTELFKPDGLLPPFLRSANAAQNADFSCISAFITFYIGALAFLISVLAFFYLLYGAFLYMTAFGDDAKATSAKKVITQAIVGLVLATLAYTIVSIVNNALSGGAKFP